MGWDAFGCRGKCRDRAPGRAEAWTYDNIACDEKQLQDRAVARLVTRIRDLRSLLLQHQQSCFWNSLRAGLAEREERKVNWDPVDMTVLATSR